MEAMPEIVFLRDSPATYSCDANLKAYLSTQN